MILAFDIPTDLIIFIVAAVIAIITKAVEASRAVRKRSLEKMQEAEAREGIDFEKFERTEREPPPRPAPRRIELPPQPEPVPIPPERARPRKPRRIHLGDTEPTAPRPPPIVTLPETVRVPDLAHADLIASLTEPNRLREAIILREILGPPKALRRQRRRLET